jgi:hypothetical protein
MMMLLPKKRLVGIAVFVVILIPITLAALLYRKLPKAPLAMGATMPVVAIQPIGGAEAFPRQGRRVLLFLSPSCSYCEEMVKQMGELRGRHPEWFSGPAAFKAALISISDPELTESFAASVTWPVYRDVDRRVLAALHGLSVPYLVLVDENGSVQYRHLGIRGLSTHEMLLADFYQTGKVR